jgi:Cof subfamily protein (haloacid dehalogenase superfamily)
MTAMRLVATDLDGTVVRPDGTVSARTRAALAACLAAGVNVVYVTGRPPRWMGEIVAQTGHRGTAICGNGAVVYDLDADQVLQAQTLPAENVRACVQRLRALMPASTFALETLAGFRREPAYLTRYDTGVEAEIGPLDDLLEDDPGVVKLLCRDETRAGDAMLALARPAVAGLASATHSDPHDGLVELSLEGVSKAATLASLAAARGVDRADVVAFGDMPNDVEMLAWAGRAYAMAGGHPDALAAAGRTAPSCLDDGVAQVLENLLRRRSA